MNQKKKWHRSICLLLLVAIVISLYSPVDAAAANADVVNDAKNGLVKENGNYRYYENGRLQKKTWKTVGSKKYYFKSNGNAAAGSYKIGSKYYIFNAKGQLFTPVKTTTVTVKGNRYRVNSKGVAVKGWTKNKKYYADKNGKLMTGIVVIKSKFYSFTGKGKLNAAKTKKLQKAAKYEKDMTSLYKLIGKPKKKKYYSGGCYGPGKDGVLTYKNFTVYTYKAPNGKEIFMDAE